MTLFTELKRRNVFRVALFYIVAAWVVIQVAETVLPMFDVPDSALRAIVIILTLGFPLAMVFSWVFEMTPEGLRRDKDLHLDPETKRETARKLNWATLIAAVLAIGLLVADRLMPEAAPGSQSVATEASSASSDDTTSVDVPDPASIAVLPFADLSPDGDQQYFSDGIAEEILNVLVGVDGLAVASRTSSFQFKGQQAIGAREIARHLEVRHVLEGSVRTAGDQIRVTAQLIDGETDQHLWSDTFDRELSTANLFAIQDEIARSIVEAIRAQLGVALAAPASVAANTDSVDAYGLFLRARALFRSRLFFEEAHALLDRALELDPRFADALSLQAAILTISPEYGVLVAATPERSRDQGEELARRALEIDPRQSLAHGILGLAQDFRLYESDQPGRYRQSIDNYDAALEIDPDDLGSLNWRGFSYLRAGYLERARTDFERCLKIEPGYSPCSSNLIAALTLSGETGRALDALDKSIRLGIYTGDIPSLINLHQLGQEQAFYFHAIGLPSLRGWLGIEEIHDALARPGEDHGLLVRRLRAHGELVGSSVSLEELRLALGEHDIRPPTYSIWFDAFRAYRQSPAFNQHMRQIGLVEFWRENGFPEFCRPIVATSGEDEIECD